MTDLHAHGVDAGPCGAAALAGARAAARHEQIVTHLGPDSAVVLFSTEGRAANSG